MSRCGMVQYGMVCVGLCVLHVSLWSPVGSSAHTRRPQAMGNSSLEKSPMKQIL